MEPTANATIGSAADLAGTHHWVLATGSEHGTDGTCRLCRNVRTCTNARAA
jgi:hypothetical protein